MLNAVIRSQAESAELEDLRAPVHHGSRMVLRAESAIGAPRLGQPQDWQRRIMPKGFVSERELNPRARAPVNLRGHRILETNNRSSKTWIECLRTKAR
jgi:hypothetical protein